MSPVTLRSYDNGWYSPGRGRLWQAAWFFLGLPLLRAAWLPGSGVRARLLRLFGARIGARAVIKPGVRVKYPWHLELGDDCWLGEDCWIDNLAPVRLAGNNCVSQGAYLCTGNHDWKDAAFGLTVAPISLGEGAWAGARSVLMPGVALGECAVAAAGSVVAKSIPAYEIHAGNPARFRKLRLVRDARAAAQREVRMEAAR